MIIFLLNLVFWGISTVLNLTTRLIFSTAAHLLVVAVRGFKLPGQAIQGTLEQLGNAFRGCLEYLLKMVVEAMGAFISSLFDALKQGVMDSAASTGSALGGLMEEMRTSLDGLIKDLAPQVLEGFTEFITSVAVNFWNNYKDAVAYVIENM